jgi:hypothetical protein
MGSILPSDISDLPQVAIRSYRGCRLEVLDDMRDGWVIVVHTPGRRSKMVLRNSTPNGLSVLLAEAKSYIDRRFGVRFESYP